MLTEPWQSISLLKSENKLLEITRDPYFEDIEWEYCIFGPVKMGEGEGARSFFEGLGMGAYNFFEVGNWKRYLIKQVELFVHFPIRPRKKVHYFSKESSGSRWGRPFFEHRGFA